MNNVSIIIANYNYGNYILTAIDTALSQTYKSNVVVVDDGSSDNSVEKITKAYPFKDYVISKDCQMWSNDRMTLISTKNMGASAARNTAIKHCWNNSDFFSILDADDMYLTKKVEVMLEKMIQYPEVGVVYTDYIIERPNYSKIEYKLPYSFTELRRQCIVHSGALIRKTHLEKVLLPDGSVYDTKLHGPASKGFIGCTEDYDLWLRLSKVCMMIHVPEIYSIVRETGNNQSLKMTQEIFHQNMDIITTR